MPKLNNNIYSHQQVVTLIGELLIDSGRAKTQPKANTMAEAWLEIKLSTGIVKPIKKNSV
jgi:hypothetical protein